MSEHSQHDPKAGKAGATPIRKLTCEEWEALLVDFLDGTLAAGEPAGFHDHRQSCPACAEMFSQAGQGREWLSFLRTEPEAPSTLVGRILAQTSGTDPRPGLNGDLIPAPAVAIAAGSAMPFWKRGGMAFAGRQAAQPRLLMTAAMAFFSITLTLNMAGVRVSTIRMTDLKPSALSANLNKQFHMTSARVVRYYDNLRFVYMLEAQAREMRQNSDIDNPPAAKPQQNAPAPTPQDGGHKSGGKSQAPTNPSSPEQRSSMLWGEKVDAALRNPFEELQAIPTSPIVVRKMEKEFFESSIDATDSRAADQAERGIA